MNLIINYLRKKFSKVPNVSDPNFSDEEVLQIIRDAGYGTFIDEYKRMSTGTGNNNQGLKGFWTRQVAGPGIEYPIIYYNEIYPFVKGGNKWTCLVSWKYDTNDNLINNAMVSEFKDKSGLEVFSLFQSGTKMPDGNDVIGKFESFDEAQVAVKNDLENYKQNVLKE